MMNIKRDTLFLVIVIILALVVAGVVLFYLTKEEVKSPEKTETTKIKAETDLTFIELTEEEKNALKEQGIEMPTSEDPSTENLRKVSSSDEIAAISADIEKTDLSSLDTEVNEISRILSGL